MTIPRHLIGSHASQAIEQYWCKKGRSNIRSSASKLCNKHKEIQLLQELQLAIRKKYLSANFSRSNVDQNFLEIPQFPKYVIGCFWVQIPTDKLGFLSRIKCIFSRPRCELRKVIMINKWNRQFPLVNKMASSNWLTFLNYALNDIRYPIYVPGSRYNLGHNYWLRLPSFNTKFAYLFHISIPR